MSWENLITPYQVYTLGVLIVLNVLASVIVSIFKGQFRLRKLADFFRTRVVPYIGGYLVMRGVAIALEDPKWEALAVATWAVLVATLVGHLLAALKSVGVNLPAEVTEKD